jgi:DNA-binding transcriptional MerR regulator
MEKVLEVTRLLDLGSLADLWRVSPHTIRLWVKQGRLSPTRICRRLLFDPAECERFLSAASTRQTSGSEEQKAS